MTRLPHWKSANPSNRRTEPVEPSHLTNPSNLAGALVAATALVVLRSAVFVFYEQAHFDSDQAITGLMARDLAHLQGFPLYFYGQHYLLAVEAWLAAPFLLVLGTSVVALKVPVLLLNGAAVLLLLWLLVRDGGLTPAASLTAAIFVVLCPPVTASRMVEAVGCNVEPFVFVPLLWLVRRRPVWFGAVLAGGALTREFVLYGASALALIALLERRYREPGALRYAGRAALGVAAVAVAVRLLSLVAANVSTTKSGPALAGIDIAAVPAHAMTLLTRILPTLFGARREPLAYFNIASSGAAGHAWLAPLLVAGLAIVFARLLPRLLGQPAAPHRRGAPVLWYLLLVGVQAAAAFVLIPNTDDMQFRYVLLALLIPVALIALHLQLEGRRALRRLSVSVVLLWAGASLADHVTLLAEYQRRRPANTVRELALYLENNGMVYGEADYWTAYHVTYLTDTRVVLSPRTLVRIPAYERLVTAHADTAVRIDQTPCPGAAHVRRWYVCR